MSKDGKAKTSGPESILDNPAEAARAADARAAAEMDRLQEPEFSESQIETCALAALVGYGRVANPEAAADYCYRVAYAMAERSRSERDKRGG